MRIRRYQLCESELLKFTTFMTNSMFLTRQEMIDFTGFKVIRCQIAALNAFQIPYKVGIHGRPVVLKSEVEKLLSTGNANSKPKLTEPNWNALGA